MNLGYFAEREFEILTDNNYLLRIYAHDRAVVVVVDSTTTKGINSKCRTHLHNLIEAADMYKSRDLPKIGLFGIIDLSECDKIRSIIPSEQRLFPTTKYYKQGHLYHKSVEAMTPSVLFETLKKYFNSQ